MPREIAVFLAIAAGTLTAKLMDPLAWLAMAVAGACGVLRLKWWWSVPLVAIAGAAWNVAAVWSWWREIGHTDVGGSITRITLSLLALCYLAYGIGRGVRRLASGGPFLRH